MNNWVKWIVALVLGALGGVIVAVSDAATFPGWYPIVRGGLIGMGPTAVALKMTLFPKGA